MSYKFVNCKFPLFTYKAFNERKTTLSNYILVIHYC